MQTRDSLSRVDAYLGRWKLSDPIAIAETPTSWIFKVKRKKNGFAALKLLRPEAGAEERYGGDMLDWYAGQGAARVYALSHDAQLIEWLDGNSLSHLVHEGKDATATDIICQIITQLHAQRNMPPPSKLPQLAQRFDDLFGADKARWPLASRDMLIRAQIVARSLLASEEETIPLHGNLHHDNILFSPRSWVAIDPKGVIGDPAYEVAHCFMYPRDASDVCASTERITRLADSFAQRLGFDRARMLGFAVAQTALSACWDIASQNPIKHQLAILPRLIAAHAVAAEPMR